jgi:hypothetical protein
MATVAMSTVCVGGNAMAIEIDDLEVTIRVIKPSKEDRDDISHKLELPNFTEVKRETQDSDIRGESDKKDRVDHQSESRERRHDDRKEERQHAVEDYKDKKEESENAKEGYEEAKEDFDSAKEDHEAAMEDRNEAIEDHEEAREDHEEAREDNKD